MIAEKTEGKIEKCQALDENGDRCKNKAIGTIQFIGDSEIYSGDVLTWCKIAVCDKHIPFVDKIKRYKR